MPSCGLHCVILLGVFRMLLRGLSLKQWIPRQLGPPPTPTARAIVAVSTRGGGGRGGAGAPPPPPPPALPINGAADLSPRQRRREAGAAQGARLLFRARPPHRLGRFHMQDVVGEQGQLHTLV